MSVSIEELKDRLHDVPGISGLTMQTLLGRDVYGFNGLIAGVDPNASPDEVEAAIRSTAQLGAFGRPSQRAEPGIPVSSASQLPPVNLTEEKPMSTPAPGSFAASIRAMMDEAREGVAQARANGLAKVGEAVDKLHDAKQATLKVSDQMVSRIEDEAASVMSELGAISNDLG